jgi:hypothetical protein
MCIQAPALSFDGRRELWFSMRYQRVGRGGWSRGRACDGRRLELAVAWWGAQSLTGLDRRCCVGTKIRLLRSELTTLSGESSPHCPPFAMQHMAACPRA